MKNVTAVRREGQASMEERLDPFLYPGSDRPMLSGESIKYEFSSKTRAVNCGGLGLIRQFVNRVDLARAIDDRVDVFKRHFPYHESDHVLSLIYNIVVGGSSLEDLKHRRQDIAFLDALGAQRIPDSSTAGDFLRRFEREHIEGLQEAILETGKRVWKRKRGRERATIDVDGTIVEVSGDCRERSDLAYNGMWGYSVLLVTLAESREVLWVENHPASRPSNEGAPAALSRCAEACLDRGFKSVLFRGDTAFTQTAHLDNWHAKGYHFVFGLMAHKKATSLANSLDESAFRPLQRQNRAPAGLRARPANQRQLVISEKGYRNLELEEEHVAEIEYQPKKCKQAYRLVIQRKRIKVSQAQHLLKPEIRYFFYITNLPERTHTASAVVAESNQRCDQENHIEQLKNGVHAMRMPTKSFLANWAYTVIGCLVLTLKSWLGLSLPKKLRMYITRCDFRTFLRDLILLPAQILRSGRRTIFRLLGFKRTLPWLLEAYEAIA